MSTRQREQAGLPERDTRGKVLPRVGVRLGTVKTRGEGPACPDGELSGLSSEGKQISMNVPNMDFYCVSCSVPLATEETMLCERWHKWVAQQLLQASLVYKPRRRGSRITTILQLTWDETVGVDCDARSGPASSAGVSRTMVLGSWCGRFRTWAAVGSAARSPRSRPELTMCCAGSVRPLSWDSADFSSAKPGPLGDSIKWIHQPILESLDEIVSIFQT